MLKRPIIDCPDGTSEEAAELKTKKHVTAHAEREPSAPRVSAQTPAPIVDAARAINGSVFTGFLKYVTATHTFHGKLPTTRPDKKTDSPAAFIDKTMFFEAKDAHGDFVRDSLDPIKTAIAASSNAVAIALKTYQHLEITPYDPGIDDGPREKTCALTNAVTQFPHLLTFGHRTGPPIWVDQAYVEWIKAAHVALWLDAYAVACIAAYRNACGEEIMIGKTFAQLWQCLTGTIGETNLPIDKWGPEQQFVPFSAYAIKVYDVWRAVVRVLTRC